MSKTKTASTRIATAALLALAAGAASAQSKVTLYGLMDMSVGSTKNVGGEAIIGAESGKMSTSYFGLSGTEDLGNGLSAFFTLDSFMRMDSGASGRFNGDAFWARNAFVGLSSKDLGTVRAGRNTTPLFVSTLLFNAFGDSFGYSPSIRHYFTSGTVTGDSGWSDSVQYLTPTWSGFSAGAIIAAGEGAGGKNYGVNAGYNSGAFASALVWQHAYKDPSTTSPLDNTETWQLNGSYDFGAAKLFGQYGEVDNKSIHRDYKIFGLGATINVGAGKILAQYGQISASAGPDRKTFSIGYDYWLSKRTDLYLVGMSDQLDGQSDGASYSLGLRHRF
ncbi:porin [Roseateles violae]|uniref:Porin n=1 Tax=Roseateles violae TaxID=3058042 RepID=A0ABT8DYS5_9BURK|nr:porin [Pelomonas sp. PFR6]MDN3922736.1 porin [Pelomonas sp. PFR6]